MNRRLLSKRSTRLLGLIAFIATGGGLIISTAINEKNFYKTEIAIIFGCFFAISLIDHFRKVLKKDSRFNINKRSLHVLICSFGEG